MVVYVGMSISLQKKLSSKIADCRTKRKLVMKSNVGQIGQCNVYLL